MKKLTMVVAMLALVMLVGVFPAVAQVDQGLAARDTTGGVGISSNVTNTGNDSNQCVTPLQFGNTGSQQNTVGVLQYGSQGGGGAPFNNNGRNGFFPFGNGFFPSSSGFSSGNVDIGGSSFIFAPVLTTVCDQSVQQSSAANSSDPSSSQYGQ